MQERNRISCWQIFSILFISRIIIFLTHSPKQSGQEDSLLTLIAGVSYFLVSLLLLAPLYLLFREHRSLNLLQLSDYAFGRYGKLITILIGLYIIFETGMELARYNLFLSTEIMDEGSTILLSIALVLSAVFGASMGIQGLARAAGIFLTLIVAAILFIFLSLIPEFELINVEPLVSISTGDFSDVLLGMLGRSVEFIALALLIPYAGGKLKIGAIWWTVGQLICYLLIMLPVLLALGQYGGTQIYPYFSAAQLAEWGILQRMDSLHLAIWVAAMFLKTSMMHYLLTMCTSHLFQGNAGRYVSYGASVVITLGGILLMQRERIFMVLNNNIVLGIIGAGFSFLLPLVVWMLAKIRRNCEVNEA